MKAFLNSLVRLTMLAVFYSLAMSQTDIGVAAAAGLVSPNLVISQFQTVGGSATTNHDDEFVEIHNTGTNPVDLQGHKLVYRSSSGVSDRVFASWTSSVVIPPGGYYLVASTLYDGTVTPNRTWSPSECQCSMSATSGGLAIRFGAADSGVILDSVGYGSATNAFVETVATTAPPQDTSRTRNNNACQDTDNNSADFGPQNPSTPRNAASTPVTCGGGGTSLLATMFASPTTVTPGGNTLLTVNVLPATTPPSTGITVIANLTNIGGSSSQALHDDGTNGDTSAGDNIYSYLATIPMGTSGGVRNVTAVAADAQARSVNLAQNITINAPPAGEDPLLLGNPSDATSDTANENNYLMHKPQYSLSYNRSKATPNWVAWRLDSTWIGSAPRQDDYRPDTSLPAGWYQVLDADYSGSGYDRGHMCPSGDRTRSIPDNSATFLMTNMVPQLSANNQGPWNDFENYLRTLAGQGFEIYIYSGGAGNAGTIAQGRIVVPQTTWKVVLVLPNGENDLDRIGKGARAFGLLVPNQPPVDQNAPWRQFRVTVDKIEMVTGYDFFSEISPMAQAIFERRRDRL